MMRKLLIVLLSLLIGYGGFAQENKLTVKSLKDVSRVKQYARTQPRYDNHGEYAALVLVQVLIDSDIDFTSTSLLGEIKKEASEYWIYMKAGAKSLDVYCPGFETLKVDFALASAGEIPSLSKQCTYELVISAPIKDAILVRDTVNVIFKKDANQASITSTMMHNGHEYIDLGLSVKWATCNVGAETPEQEGSYYAWGEVNTKAFYNWNTYKWCYGTSDSFTKYSDSSFGNSMKDDKKSLELLDDAAHMTWNGAWRIPTYEEWKELLENCIWEFRKFKNKKGYIITSRINGNSIFLPAAGGMEDNEVEAVGISGFYWCNSIIGGALHSYYASILHFNFDKVVMDYSSRECGLSIRPVCP